MTVGLGNVKALGRCSVTFDSVDCGVAEGVKAKLLHRVHVINAEAFGPVPVAVKTGGLGIEIEAVFLETEFDVIKKLLTDSLTKVVGTATTGTKLTAGGEVKADDASTGALLIVPKDADLAGFSLTVHKAVVVESDPEFAFMAEEKLQGAFMVKFVGLLDTTRTAGDMLFAFGVPGASVA